jgi:hypothetical protein
VPGERPEREHEVKPKLIKVQLNGAEVEVCEVRNGKPVFGDEGKEIEFDALHARDKIKSLSDERDTLRTRAETAENEMKPWKELGDLEKVKQATQIAADVANQKLIDKGEAERVRKEAIDAYEKAAKTRQDADTATIREKDAHISNLLIDEAFTRSKFVTEKLAIPPDIARVQFGDRLMRDAEGKIIGGNGLVVETVNGKPALVPYFDGRRLTSSRRPGEFADADEAIEKYVDAYPHKEKILKSPDVGGTGAAGVTEKGLNTDLNKATGLELLESAFSGGK